MARTRTFRIFRKRIAKLPALWFDKEALGLIAKASEGSIIDNILKQIQATGAPLKRNAPSTVAEKRRRGWLVAGRAMALIAHLKRFVQGDRKSWRATIDVAKQTVTIRPATRKLAKLSRFVQLKGYIGWFGIGKTGRDAIRAALRQWVDRQFKKAGQRA